ncbi:MAG TPA: exodeoxyribonuclease V subunit gamma [Syntrophales bacterium]|nr:exodeoxyribonuclease V subunit gamma [Syntrophales bacterium]
MPGLKLYHSNRMEVLADRLAEILAAPLVEPFAPEIVLVQSRGMERWLSMALADRHGVCTNVRFPYPTHFVHALFQAVDPALPARSPYEPAVMTWDLVDLLSALPDRPEFQPLTAYLGDDGNGLKRYQLASRIAALFDQYLLFRPEWMPAWERGQETHWQAALWREIVRRKGPVHRVALRRRLLATIGDATVPLPGALERIAMFGISSLPPFYMQILAALAARIEVNLFIVNPCREFWEDIVSEREAGRIAERLAGYDRRPEAYHLEAGNRLLASLGPLGREFLQTIAKLSAEEFPEFVDPGDATLLAAIQSHILNLTERTSAGGAGPFADDGSLRVHVCHSPLRETEILHDALLAMFDEDRTLRPDEVLVMIPDITAYAPFIQAVFSAAADDPRAIPFTLADRGYLQESPLVDAFFRLIDLAGSRFGASAVLGLLDAPAVRERFSLADDDVRLIRHWVRETGIRWGIDARSREALDLPAEAANTWRAGLDRMLLGYALPAGGEAVLVDGIFPYDDIEGGAAEILGPFLAFTEALFTALPALETGKTLSGWAQALTALLETFFSDDERYGTETQALRRLFGELPELEAASGYAGDVSIEGIRAVLRETLADRGSGGGFLAGGVTFSTLLPMRSIPFRVIALLGMNDDAYPRPSVPLGFDRMAASPRPGDRSRRQDDRYLFLEALLSARQRLHISYCGQSPKDNRPRPPSVLVSELLDYIEAAFGPRVREGLCAHHRLQAFDPTYFRGDPGLYSYSTENLRAAERAAAPRREPEAFIPAGLPEPEAGLTEIDVETFCAFFAHPARFLLRRRLGLYLRDREAALPEEEPFTIEGLDAYGLGEDLVARLLADRGIAQAYPVLKAAGRLPHGAPGAYAYDGLHDAMAGLAADIGRAVSGGRLKAVPVDLRLAGIHLAGALDPLYPEGLVRYRPADVKARDRLDAWIRHLILNHPGCAAPVRETRFIGRDGGVRYAPLADAERTLADLVALYLAGLRTPLHFFPESSLAYADATMKGKDAAAALRAARDKWEAYRYAEKDDPDNRLCFGRIDPLDDAFRRLAETVFHPLLAAEEGLP